MAFGIHQIALSFKDVSCPQFSLGKISSLPPGTFGRLQKRSLPGSEPTTRQSRGQQRELCLISFRRLYEREGEICYQPQATVHTLGEEVSLYVNSTVVWRLFESWRPHAIIRLARRLQALRLTLQDVGLVSFPIPWTVLSVHKLALWIDSPALLVLPFAKSTNQVHAIYPKLQGSNVDRRLPAYAWKRREGKHYPGLQRIMLQARYPIRLSCYEATSGEMYKGLRDNADTAFRSRDRYCEISEFHHARKVKTLRALASTLLCTAAKSKR